MPSGEPATVREGLQADQQRVHVPEQPLEVLLERGQPLVVLLLPLQLDLALVLGVDVLQLPQHAHPVPLALALRDAGLQVHQVLQDGHCLLVEALAEVPVQLVDHCPPDQLKLLDLLLEGQVDAVD
jgi:hypothetical protein